MYTHSLGVVDLVRGQPSPARAASWPHDVCLLPADGRRHGDDDLEHPRAAAALRVAAAQLAGGVADLGRQPSSSFLLCTFLVPWQGGGGSVGCPPPSSDAKDSAEKT